jgi:hypothetical protein
MIDIFIRSMLGTFFSKILDLYIANSLWINGIILAYALLVVISRFNYARTSKAILDNLKEKYSTQIEKKNASSLIHVLNKAEIPWAESIKKSKIPLLTPPGSIRIYWKTVNNMQKFLPIEKIVELLKAKDEEVGEQNA